MNAYIHTDSSRVGPEAFSFFTLEAGGDTDLESGLSRFSDVTTEIYRFEYGVDRTETRDCIRTYLYVLQDFREHAPQ